MTKTGMTAAALLAGLTASAAATGAAAGTDYAYKFKDHTIYVSCYRGPLKEVIWDRPNAKFVDSLVTLGYDYPTSHAIAERVCRDDALVFNPDGLTAEMKRIYADSPQYRKR